MKSQSIPYLVLKLKIQYMFTRANCMFALELKALERIPRPACAREGMMRAP